MKQQNLKKEKGITLVALVVTIVVLLILAGVSISMVLGNNGLITKATDAKARTEQDAINTETAMNNLYDELVELVGGENNEEYCPDCGELIDECICDEESEEEYCPDCDQLIEDCICGEDEEEGGEYCENCGQEWIDCTCCPYCGSDDGHYEYCDICGECWYLCYGEHETCGVCEKYDFECECERCSICSKVLEHECSGEHEICESCGEYDINCSCE